MKTKSNRTEKIQGQFNLQSTRPYTNYAEYMSTPGKYGTFTELTAAAELFNFNGIIFKEESENYESFEFGLTDDYKADSEKPRLFMLFNGPTDQGHFRYLHPIQPTTLPLISNGLYKKINGSLKNKSPKQISTYELISGNTKQKDSNKSGKTPIIDPFKILRINDESICHICHKAFKGKIGVRVHISKKHPTEAADMKIKKRIDKKKKKTI